jgi:uncharacterized repeat protein (TIGR04138 family)
MNHPAKWLQQLVTKDPRYNVRAYEFLFEALEFTRCRLAEQRGGKVRHVSAHELLEGIRLLAIQQFGLLAQTVLNQWGLHATSDFGEMVFNLIESGEMEKTDEDTRSDFDDIYDFSEAFKRDYKIEVDELEGG